MALKLAFIGHSNNLTRVYLRQFVFDNREQVERYDELQGMVYLKDGTTIKAIFRPFRFLDGLRFDQVIVADDRRLNLLHSDTLGMRILSHYVRYSTNVPESEKFIVYDIDAEEGRL